MDNEIRKGKQWKPDIKIAEMLRHFWIIPVTAYYTSKQKTPAWSNIEKMPNRKTVMKYFDHFNEEAAKPFNKSLAITQRHVRAQFLESYDKNIMVTEDQIQKILRWREEDHAVYKKKIDKLHEEGKDSEIEPYVPNLDFERALSHFNDVQGNFKLSRAGVESASFIDQRSEMVIVKEMEQKLEKQMEKQSKLVKVKKNAKK